MGNEAIQKSIRYIEKIIEKGPVTVDFTGVTRANLNYYRRIIKALMDNGNIIVKIEGKYNCRKSFEEAYNQAKIEAYINLTNDPVAIGFVDVDRRKLRDTDMIYASAGIYHNQTHKDNTEADPQYESWYGFTQNQLVGMLIHCTRNIIGEVVEPYQLEEIEEYVKERLGLEKDCE